MPRLIEGLTKGSRAWAASEFLAARAGLPSESGSTEAQKHHDLKHLGFRELARESLRDAGVSPGGNDHELFNRALTTSDFPKILAATANKALEHGYRYAPGTFLEWAARGSNKDFRQFSIVRTSPPADLPVVNEEGEYTRLRTEEGEEVARLRTRGGILGISRQTLINDDLGAFKNLGRTLGMTAKMTQNRQVYRQLLSNPSLSDGTPVFDASRGNLLSGADSALGKDSLATAVKTLRMLSDDAGNPLQVEPKILLVPPSLEMTAHELCFSDSIPGQNNAAVPNFFKKIGIVPVVDPLLESPALTGYSSTAWYLLPDPKLWPVFMALTLDNEDNLEPYTDSRAVFERDEVQYKVRIDFDCCAVGAKAIKSAGQ